MNHNRASGILLHITSLPAKYGIGDLGPEAFRFADFLASARQRLWQILPINPPAISLPHSPYNCLSAFAGSPLLISPQYLYRDGLLKRRDIADPPPFAPESINFRRVIPFKRKLLNIAFKNFLAAKPDAAYDDFCTRYRDWLDDYALFLTIRNVHKTGDWGDWPAELRDRRPHALASFRDRHARIIQKHKFLQYIFFKQYNLLKLYCNQHGIRIVGDIPIYVSYQSADVWAHPQFFNLNRAGKPCFVSGTPPDCFSATGQLWGNPVYDWPQLKKEGFSWWLDRIAHNLDIFDIVRIDHFRGLVAYWRIPAHHKTAAHGTWVRAPKDSLFKAIQPRFEFSRLIVEDLGRNTPAIDAFMKKHRLTGMRILQFGLTDENRSNPHLPANHPKRSVVYTGTHDNNTIIGWFCKEITPHQRQVLAAKLDKQYPREERHWQFICTAMESSANLAIIPMQDILGLGAEARMNLPATMIKQNWTWRMNPRQLTAPLAGKLRQITIRTKR